MRWMLVLAVSGLACGGQAPSEVPASAEDSRSESFVCEEPGSDSQEKSLSTDDTVLKISPGTFLDVGHLAALPESTTPVATCVRLNRDLDYVLVQARITGTGFTTGCQLAELYRIGPAARQWAVGEIQRFPLDYALVLPPGLYTQKIDVWGLAAGDGRWTQARRHDVFEVDSAGLRPRSLAEQQAAWRAALDPTGAYVPSMEPYVPSPPDPCTAPAPYTDVISGETASESAFSRVDVDSWQNVSTIQPLRWYRTVVPERGAPSPPRLLFLAQDANGAGIRWDIQVPTDEPAAFEATGGQLNVSAPQDPDTRPTGWSGSAMNVAVSLDGPTRLRVQLSNIVLEKGRLNDEPRVTRTLDSASIVGEWIQQ